MHARQPLFTSNFHTASTKNHRYNAVQMTHHGRARLDRTKTPLGIRYVWMAILLVTILTMQLHPWDYVAHAADSPRLYTVRSGDSIWNIAERIDGSEDIYQITNEIMTINHLNGDATIQPGEILKLPTNAQ